MKNIIDYINKYIFKTFFILLIMAIIFELLYYWSFITFFDKVSVYSFFCLIPVIIYIVIYSTYNGIKELKNNK